MVIAQNERGSPVFEMLLVPLMALGFLALPLLNDGGDDAGVDDPPAEEEMMPVGDLPVEPETPTGEESEDVVDDGGEQGQTLARTDDLNDEPMIAANRDIASQNAVSL